MNIKDKQEFLAKVSIFAKCKSGDLKALAKTCREMTFSQGEVICKQGERGSALFLIILGRAEVLEERADGSVIKLAELGEEAVIGELAVIDGEQRSATVVAVQKTMCLVLTTWDLMATVKDRPLIAMDILKMIIARYRALADKIRDVPVEHA
jgi:CRP-like cAMP-binding protein